MSDFNGFPNYQSTWQYYPQVNTAPAYMPRWQQPTAPAMPYQQSQTQQMQNGMCWVQGESGAKSYVLPNGTTLPLWDSERQTIYIKSVDANGKPSMTILDYTERTSSDEKQNDVKSEDYVTKDQFNSLNNQYTSVSEQIEKLANHIDDIENRITSFSKPQQNSNRRGNNK